MTTKPSPVDQILKDVGGTTMLELFEETHKFLVGLPKDQSHPLPKVREIKIDVSEGVNKL